MLTLLQFIPSIINKDWEHFNALLIVLIVLYTCIFVSVLIDLYFGVKRAKRLEIACTSIGFRRTVTKLISYFGLMLMLTIADIIASIIFQMPYFTVIGAIGIVMIEAKSVFENTKQDNKNIEQLPKTLHKLFESKDAIKALTNFLNSQNQNT